MIRGMHGVFFTPEAGEARSFVKEKLELPHADAGNGWLIFGVPEAEFAFHRADGPHHQLSFRCDDVDGTVAQLQAKGVVLTSPVTDQGFGLVTSFELPGGLEVMLYEPKHAQL